MVQWKLTVFKQDMQDVPSLLLLLSHHHQNFCNYLYNFIGVLWQDDVAHNWCCCHDKQHDTFLFAYQIHLWENKTHCCSLPVTLISNLNHGSGDGLGNCFSAHCSTYKQGKCRLTMLCYIGMVGNKGLLNLVQFYMFEWLYFLHQYY